MDEAIGVIGLGPMGGNIARLLLKIQMRVAGYDIKPECMAALDDLGLNAAADSQGVASEAAIIIT